MSNCFWSKSFCIRHPVSYGTSSSLKSISFTRRLVGCNSEGCRIPARATITRSNLPLFFSFFLVVWIVALLLLQKRNNSPELMMMLAPIQSVCCAKGARRKTLLAAFKCQNPHKLSLCQFLATTTRAQDISARIGRVYVSLVRIHSQVKSLPPSLLGKKVSIDWGTRKVIKNVRPSKNTDTRPILRPKTWRDFCDSIIFRRI